MTQTIVASDLASMGATKSDSNSLTLNGVSYFRGISFSQRVQDVAERVCREYQQQNIKCLLIKEGLVLTLWLSQPAKPAINEAQKRSLPPKIVPSPPQPERVLERFGKQAIVESPSISELQFHPDDTELDDTQTEKIMSYRGRTYIISTNEETSPEGIIENQSEAIKKRMYRGRVY